MINPGFDLLEETIDTTLSIRVHLLAFFCGVSFRIGPNPRACMIDMDDPGVTACYVGNGIVFLRDETLWRHEDMDLIALHELGHALIDRFGDSKSPLWDEIKANAAMLVLAAVLMLPVHEAFRNPAIDAKMTASFDADGIRRHHGTP